jgi:hypothetical protein
VTEQTVLVPAVTAAAIGVLVLRLRDPLRRPPVAATVEAFSVTLGGVLVVQLLLLGGSWSELVSVAGLTGLFASSVAGTLAMGRALAAVFATRGWQHVPLDAIVSFGAVSAVAAFVSGVMLLTAFGGRVTALVATVAILRAGASPWRAREVIERWAWGPRRPSRSRDDVADDGGRLRRG